MKTRRIAIAAAVMAAFLASCASEPTSINRAASSRKSAARAQPHPRSAALRPLQSPLPSVEAQRLLRFDRTM